MRLVNCNPGAQFRADEAITTAASGLAPASGTGGSDERKLQMLRLANQQN